MLARAREAEIPLFYCSESELDELYVGVGARRMRDVFAGARNHAPCIVFNNVIDSVGGKRND